MVYVQTERKEATSCLLGQAKVALHCQTNLIRDAQKPLFQPVNFALGKSGCKHWTKCISLDQDKCVLKRTMKQEKGVQWIIF